MIAFIDLRHAKGRTLNETPARFAFFDANLCAFLRLGLLEAWSTWSEFEAQWKKRYDRPHSPYHARYDLGELRRVVGARSWVFKADDGR